MAFVERHVRSQSPSLTELAVELGMSRRSTTSLPKVFVFLTPTSKTVQRFASSMQLDIRHPERPDADRVMETAPGLRQFDNDGPRTRVLYLIRYRGRRLA